MYLIKSIAVDNMAETLKVNDGIKIAKIGNDILTVKQFWGSTNVTINELADESKIVKKDKDIFYTLSYVTNFENNNNFVEDIGDGFKKLNLLVSSYQPDNVEGYIIFIEKSLNEIQTNGETVFKRYPTEIVAILREGQSLKVDGKLIEVVNNKLMLNI